MKVKIELTVDIDNDAYAQRFWPNEADFDKAKRAAFIRDEVQGAAASAVVHQLLGGHIADGGCLTGYKVAVWDAEEAQVPA